MTLSELEEQEGIYDSPRKQLRRTLASGKWQFDIESESEVVSDSKMLTLLELPGRGQIIADSGQFNSFHIRDENDLSIKALVNH